MTPDLVVVESGDVDAATRGNLDRLWARAFGDLVTDDDRAHAFGGVHVVACVSDELLGHASAVGRNIQFAEESWQPIGYVEAVAVDPGAQRSGVGRQLMERLHVKIDQRWPAAMLSTGRATGFYERLGWERWRGISYTKTTSGIVADDEHGGLMIRRRDSSVIPDLTVDVTCEDRCGDAW